SVEEIQAKRAARKAANKLAYDKQFEKDLEALNALEEEHGDGAVEALAMPRYVPGLPTLAIFKCPDAPGFKRCKDRQLRAKGNAEAINFATNELSAYCRVYPEENLYKEMLVAAAGFQDSAGAKCIAMAQAKADEEGK